MKRKLIRRLALVAFLLICIVDTGEIVLDYKGYQLNWHRHLLLSIQNIPEPNVRHIWEKCGWGPYVGSSPSDEDSDVIETVWPNGMRECRPQMEKPALFKVGVFGCSYTYGEGVPAEETFVYRLNTRYPKVCFDNWGMRGTGLVHSYLAMQQAVARGQKYDLVVFDAICGHFARDQYLYAVGDLQPNKIYVVAPQIHRDWLGRYTITYSNERHWPLENRLLTVDFLQRVYYGWRVEWARKQKERDELSGVYGRHLPGHWEYCIKSMAELAKENGSDFLVCCLDGGLTVPIRELEGIPTIIVDPVDSSEARNRVRGIPGFHPNANVNAFWVQEFSKWFDHYLKRKCPEALAGVNGPRTNMKFAWDFAAESQKSGAKAASTVRAWK